MIAPPEGGNYIDTNLNLTSRLEGVTPVNTICISAILYQIVVDVLRGYTFEELESEFKGLGQNKYYLVSNSLHRTLEPSRREARLSFYFSTIEAFRESNNLDAIKATCEQALIDFPDHPEFTMQLGEALFWLKRFTQSIDVYQKCVQMSYNLKEAYNRIGHAYRRLSDFEQAIFYFHKAVEYSPNDFHSLGSIARIHLLMGDHSEASKFAKASLKLNRQYLFPISILMAIALIEKNDKALTPLIKRIAEYRHELLREDTESLMTALRKTGYKKRLDLAFKSLS